jgi:DNA repair and recombination protein RAD54 and RAD54-like protein
VEKNAGLGKTLQSVTLIYTLLKTGITADKRPTAKRVIVVCPCSLVKNWDNEFVKWLGPGAVKVLALAEADRKQVEKDLDSFVKTSIFQILICSYECLRTHVGRLTKHRDCCDLLVCDEAHRLKNSDNQTSRALNSLPVKRRVLLTGTPMQNDLQEFFAMVDFTNPGILVCHNLSLLSFLSWIVFLGTSHTLASDSFHLPGDRRGISKEHSVSNSSGPGTRRH